MLFLVVYHHWFDTSTFAAAWTVLDLKPCDHVTLVLQEWPKKIQSNCAWRYKDHISKTADKLKSRYHLISKLTGMTWGANASTLRTLALALCYSVAEYCCPVWARSGYARRNSQTCWLPTKQHYVPEAWTQSNQKHDWRSIVASHVWNLLSTCTFSYLFQKRSEYYFSSAVHIINSTELMTVEFTGHLAHKNQVVIPVSLFFVRALARPGCPGSKGHKIVVRSFVHTVLHGVHCKCTLLLLQRCHLFTFVLYTMLYHKVTAGYVRMYLWFFKL